MQFKTNHDGNFILKGGSVYNLKKEGFRIMQADSLILIIKVIIFVNGDLRSRSQMISGTR